MGFFKQVGEIEPKITLSALIYGQPGVGKTTLACSAPHAVLLDFDGGVTRINGAHMVPTLQVKSWDEVTAALQVLDTEVPDCQTVVVDTAGKMVDFISAYMRLMGIERIGFRTALAIVWGVESANGAKRTDKAD